MNQLGGLALRMPVWSFFMVFFVLSSVGLPGLNGFVGEFFCLIGAFTATADHAGYPGVLGPWYAAAAGVGMIFAAMYLLIMTGKVVWGPLREPGGHGHGAGGHAALPADLSAREIAILAPLAALCLYIGFQPRPLTDAVEGSVELVLKEYPVQAALAARGKSPGHHPGSEPGTDASASLGPGPVQSGRARPTQPDPGVEEPTDG
jgi:NADH-quinone oxidoreductase subunit M